MTHYNNYVYIWFPICCCRCCYGPPGPPGPPKPPKPPKPNDAEKPTDAAEPTGSTETTGDTETTEPAEPGSMIHYATEQAGHTVGTSNQGIAITVFLPIP